MNDQIVPTETLAALPDWVGAGAVILISIALGLFIVAIILDWPRSGRG